MSEGDLHVVASDGRAYGWIEPAEGELVPDHPPVEVQRSSALVPVSQEALDDAAGVATVSTPWLREAADRRAAERAGAQPVPLTLDALLDKLGFSDAYAEHLAQPYCTCGNGYDGWDVCRHAEDLRLTP